MIRVLITRRKKNENNQRDMRGRQDDPEGGQNGEQKYGSNRNKQKTKRKTVERGGYESKSKECGKGVDYEVKS